MQIKSTVACALTLMAVASARPVNNNVDAESIQAQVQAELQEKLQNEQVYGDFSGVTEKSFQSLAPLNQQFDINASIEADANASVDFDALLQEQQELIQHSEKAYRPHPMPHCSFGPSSSSCSYGPSSSSSCSYGPSSSSSCGFGPSSSSCGFGPSSSSYGCPAPRPMPCPAPGPMPCAAPCPVPMPGPLPGPLPGPICNTGCPLPVPTPCPLPQQYTPCFASPFFNEYCDESSSSSCPSSSSSSYSSSSASEIVFNINDYKFDVCGASAFGVVAQLRMIGLRYPNNPNAAQRTAFINFITGIVENFPCTQQRTVMASYLAANPINVNDRKSFNKWAATFAKHVLTETKFPLGLNLQGMFAPVNNKRVARK